MFSPAQVAEVLQLPHCIFTGSAPPIIERIAKSGRQIVFSKGNTIFRDGDAAGWMYILLDGTVETSLNGIRGRQMGRGSVGGLTSSLPPMHPQDKHLPLRLMKRSMTHTVVSSQATILQVRHELFRELLKDHDFAVATIQFLQGKLRRKTKTLSTLMGSREETKPPGSEANSSSVPTSQMKIAVFDTKAYDRKYLTAAIDAFNATSAWKMQPTFLEVKLNQETAPLAAGYDAVCIFVNDSCNPKVVAMLKSLSVGLILLRCAGFNNVAIAEASSMGICTARVPAYSPFAVAEHAFALLSSVNRHTNRAYNRVREGNFSLSGLEGRDLHGLTVAVAGCGKIGRCFAAIAKGCGMKVICYDKYPDKKWAEATGATFVGTLQELFPKADVLSLHLPLTKDTHHLVNAATIATMPKGAIIVNTSRGAIVDTNALLQGLVSGHLGGAGLDVYEDGTAYVFEDRSHLPIADSVLARLVNLPNVVLTSHQALHTSNVLTAIAETTVSNAAEYWVVSTASAMLRDRWMTSEGEDEDAEEREELEGAIELMKLMKNTVMPAKL